MPYKKNPTCRLSSELTRKIWRYMDITKFIALLENRALFFPNIQLFPDPMEGYLSTLTHAKLVFADLNLSEQEQRKSLEIKKRNLDILKSGRDSLYISAWHMNDNESVAMWRLYLKSDEGIAIQSTIQRFISAISESDEVINIGEVEYIDFNREETPCNNVLAPALFKRKSYEHEKEIRAIILRPNGGEGINVKIDTNMLIEKIYLAPGMPEWIYGLVGKILKRYNLDKRISSSSLDQVPMY